MNQNDKYKLSSILAGATIGAITAFIKSTNILSNLELQNDSYVVIIIFLVFSLITIPPLVVASYMIFPKILREINSRNILSNKLKRLRAVIQNKNFLFMILYFAISMGGARILVG